MTCVKAHKSLGAWRAAGECIVSVWRRRQWRHIHTLGRILTAKPVPASSRPLFIAPLQICVPWRCFIGFFRRVRSSKAPLRPPPAVAECQTGWRAAAAAAARASLATREICKKTIDTISSTLLYVDSRQLFNIPRHRVHFNDSNKTYTCKL